MSYVKWKEIHNKQSGESSGVKGLLIFRVEIPLIKLANYP